MRGKKERKRIWVIFFFKQKTAYDVKECDWSSDVCSSDLKIQATCGEVTAPQLRKIADIAEQYGRGFIHFGVRDRKSVV